MFSKTKSNNNFRQVFANIWEVISYLLNIVILGKSCLYDKIISNESIASHFVVYKRLMMIGKDRNM
jgi:uncharacterized membrane protein